MKRMLNEEFLYNGNSYFIKYEGGITESSQCSSCPLNNSFYSLFCIPTEIIDCYGRCKIIKK